MVAELMPKQGQGEGACIGALGVQAARKVGHLFEVSAVVRVNPPQDGLAAPWGISRIHPGVRAIHTLEPVGG